MPTLLIAASSPTDQDRLRLGNETKNIREALKRSRNPEKWTVESCEAATVDDLRRALLDYNPTIVHFSGHGAGEEGLCFESEDGTTHIAKTIAIAKLLHVFKDQLKCVVLNACYSEIQAKEICKEIDYVIGMNESISDDAATKFAVAFYDAVFAQVDFRKSFDLGCVALDIHDDPDANVPVFMTGGNLGYSQLDYTEDVPEIENFLLAYINTPFAERYRFTTKGEAIRDAMTAYYSESVHYKMDSVTVLYKSVIIDDVFKVTALLSSNRLRNQQLVFYVKIINRNILIDWEASNGIWSMPPKTYLAMGTDKPIVARVMAELGSSYYSSWSDKRPYVQSIHLKTFSWETLYGYVLRNSPEGIDLINYLSDGNSHPVTLLIRNVDENYGDCLILQCLAKSWVLQDQTDS